MAEDEWIEECKWWRKAWKVSICCYAVVFVVFAVIGVEVYQPIHKTIDAYYRFEQGAKRLIELSRQPQDTDAKDKPLDMDAVQESKGKNMMEYEEHLRRLGIETEICFEKVDRDGHEALELYVYDGMDWRSTGRVHEVHADPQDMQKAVADSVIDVVLEWVSDCWQNRIDFSKLPIAQPETQEKPQ